MRCSAAAFTAPSTWAAGAAAACLVWPLLGRWRIPDYLADILKTPRPANSASCVMALPRVALAAKQLFGLRPAGNDKGEMPQCHLHCLPHLLRSAPPPNGLRRQRVPHLLQAAGPASCKSCKRRATRTRPRPPLPQTGGPSRCASVAAPLLAQQRPRLPAVGCLPLTCLHASLPLAGLLQVSQAPGGRATSAAPTGSGGAPAAALAGRPRSGHPRGGGGAWRRCRGGGRAAACRRHRAGAATGGGRQPGCHAGSGRPAERRAQQPQHGGAADAAPGGAPAVAVRRGGGPAVGPGPGAGRRAAARAAAGGAAGRVPRPHGRRAAAGAAGAGPPGAQPGPGGDGGAGGDGNEGGHRAGAPAGGAAGARRAAWRVPGLDLAAVQPCTLCCHDRWPRSWRLRAPPLPAAPRARCRSMRCRRSFWS